eukprot:SAG11_NODE_83_length_17378_cov_5.388622_4_plen_93_part_00
MANLNLVIGFLNVTTKLVGRTWQGAVTSVCTQLTENPTEIQFLTVPGYAVAYQVLPTNFVNHACVIRAVRVLTLTTGFGAASGDQNSSLKPN